MRRVGHRATRRRVAIAWGIVAIAGRRAPIIFTVRVRAFIRSPESYFVAKRRYQCIAANGAKAGSQDLDRNVIREIDCFRRFPAYERTEHWHFVQQRDCVSVDHSSLRLSAAITMTVPRSPGPR